MTCDLPVCGLPSNPAVLDVRIIEVDKVAALPQIYVLSGELNLRRVVGCNNPPLAVHIATVRSWELWREHRSIVIFPVQKDDLVHAPASVKIGGPCRMCR